MDETWTSLNQRGSNNRTVETPRFSVFQVTTVMSAGKVMAAIFWDAEGVLLVDDLDKGHTITGAYYSDLLRQLRETIKQIRRGKLTRRVLFHQKNAPAHTSTVAMAAAQKCGFQLVEHSPYSRELGPSDCYLFPKRRSVVRDDDVMNAVHHFLSDQNGVFYT